MLQTKYITLDEFNQYFQMRLETELGSQENAIGFLKRIEDRIETYINSNFCKNIHIYYAKFSEYQKEHYKLALLEQAIYIFRNGDISVDSGLDADRGIIARRNDIRTLSIAPNCIENLRLCGLWNRNIYGRSLIL